MNEKIRKWLTEAAFLAFSIALIVWTASLTLGVMDIVLPHSTYVKYFALALFDGGTLTWLFVYIAKARGTPQRGASLLMTILDFLGVVLMVIGGIYLGGQGLTDVPAWMGKALVNGTIAATVINLGMVYFYHANGPETREAIQAQDLEDTLNEESMQQARVNVEREARVLGAILARRATARIKYRLALPMNEAEAAEWRGETIEASAEDVNALPAPVRHTFWDGVTSFFGRGRSMPSHDTPLSKNSTKSQQDDQQGSPPEPPAEA